MSVVAPRPSPSVDLASVKLRQQAAWATGNYAVVGTTLQIVGEQLCEAMDLRAGMKVLDVAAGNGNASLAAARRYCEVTSTDYVSSLLDAGILRARAEGLHIHFEEADAEQLPYADASFDAVLSTFGVMFAPDQRRSAAELLRVCRPGGRIGLANWTPDSFIGEVFRTLALYLPPAPELKSPSLWGSAERINELFADGARGIHLRPRLFTFRYLSPEHWLQVFRTFYGPINKAYAALDEQGQQCLSEDLLSLLGRHNLSGDATLVLPSAYLEVIIERA